MSTQKIQILYDPQGLEDIQEKPPSITVTSVSEYVRTYKLISDSLNENRPVKIIVKNPTVFAWLSKLNDKYPQEIIEIKEVKPRLLLAEKWGFNIPDEVRDEEIIELNLLSFVPDRKTSTDFTNFILSKFISPIMNSENIPLENLSSLATSLSSDNVMRNLNKPLVQREFVRKIESWIKNAKSEDEREIVDMLLQNSQGLRISLSQFAILANYPIEAGERAIGTIFLTFKNLGLLAKNIEIDRGAIQTAAGNIEIFLNTRFNTNLSHSDTLSIIHWCSGLVPEEFIVIENFLKKHPNVIDKDVLQALEQKFSGVIQIIQPELHKLSLIVRPNIPGDPDEAWSATKMLEWAIQQYLPYHFWLEETNETDAQSSIQCEVFGDWLYSNFIDLRSNFPNMAYKILPSIINMNTSEKCLLAIVIDNFNYKFADVLANLLQNVGLRLVQKQPYLSMIPSDTETSKRCLFAGQPKVTDIDPLADYDSLVSKEWQKDFPQRRFIYLQSTLDLEEAKASTGDVVLVNCTQIDAALHQDERKLGKRHSLQIETELQNIATLITQFCNRNSLTNDVLILICSDHGSTLIPDKSHNEIDPTFFVGKTIDTHHRFISISKAEYDRLPENVREYQTYFLDSELFGLSQNVLVARGYYRFKKTNEHFYVHGGLSPEETILPFMIFEGGKPEPKKPIIRLTKNEFRYVTKSLVEIEIINENSAPIEDVQLSIAPIPGEVEVIEPAPKIEKIDPANLSNTKIALRFYRKFDATQGIEVTTEFKLLGRSYIERQRFPVQMKSLMETSFKL